MSPFQNTEGIVIKKKTVRESDLLITLLTPTQGKIVVLAKGAKNIKSSRLGALELGNIVKVHLYTKNNFTWVSEAQAVTSFLNRPKILVQLNLLFYFLEIINALVAENQSTLGLYPVAKDLIRTINQNHFSEFIGNEIKFIEIMGFGIPPEIHNSFKKNDYQLCQKLLKQYLESIVEKPLESNKLFK